LGVLTLAFAVWMFCVFYRMRLYKFDTPTAETDRTIAEIEEACKAPLPQSNQVVNQNQRSPPLLVLTKTNKL